MAGFDRIDRISAEVARELDRILRDEVHDPRLGGTWSILRAELYVYLFATARCA